MDILVKELKKIATTNQLERFEWEIPDNCPVNIPSSLFTGYEKNIYLKNHFHSVIANSQGLDNYYWAIQEWGGIGSFKKNERNDQRIKKFIEELSKGRLTRNSFDAISSLSKVASFIEPENYVIYDSRVIYSLNWLLFNHSKEKCLFPQPVGRSASLAKYDMQTIFRLTKKKFEYRSHKNAFHDYCSLIKNLSNSVFGADSKPYKLEMLLFMIAPTWVIESIETNVSLEIATIA